MKVFFVVQGDGRGHMTQAIALREMLENSGHEVSRVLIGSNQSRVIPPFFRQAFTCPVSTFDSPGFSMKQGRDISHARSVAHCLRALPRYRRSLEQIASEIQAASPDLVVNFLEPLVGYLNLRRRLRPPTLTVAHHFMFEHPRYPRLPGSWLQRWSTTRYVRLNGARSIRLALSFYEAEDLPERRTYVCPPVLRRQLFQLRPEPGNYLLVYLLNHGYAADIIQWHTRHPHVPVHCFFDRPGAPAEDALMPNLTFHALNGEKFLRLMAGARGVVCTAGFESISEAAYLGKPLLMVPVKNHPEQSVNALDAELAGLGIRDSGFALSRLLDYPAASAQNSFRKWVDRAPEIVAGVIERALRTPAVSSPLRENRDIGRAPDPAAA